MSEKPTKKEILLVLYHLLLITLLLAVNYTLKLCYPEEPKMKLKSQTIYHTVNIFASIS